MRIFIIILILMFISCDKEEIELKKNTFIDERDMQEYRYIIVDSFYFMIDNLNFETAKSRKFNKARLYDFYEAYEICPKDWQLATVSQWRNILDNHDAEIIYDGYCVNNTEYYADVYGYYWTRDIAVKQPYYMRFSIFTDYFIDTLMKEYKLSVRCIKNK